MKTRNITNRRFLGIAVIMVVLGLGTGNLTAQRSLNDFTLVSLNNYFVQNDLNEMIRTLYYPADKNSARIEDPIEDWMMNPVEWNKKTDALSAEEANFEESEMILEDWMSRPSEWNTRNSELLNDELNFKDSEMIIEDWMMRTNWTDHTQLEDELQIEEWMVNPASW